MNINSQFPNAVDDLLYFSDLEIKDVSDANEYRKHFVSGTIEKTDDINYEEAEKYLQTHDNINGYFAKLFNLLFNRLVATQQFLFNLVKEYLTAYGKDSDEAMNYKYIDEDNCWLDISLDNEEGDPDYEGERSVKTNCPSYVAGLGNYYEKEKSQRVQYTHYTLC